MVKGEWKTETESLVLTCPAKQSGMTMLIRRCIFHLGLLTTAVRSTLFADSPFALLVHGLHRLLWTCTTAICNRHSVHLTVAWCTTACTYIHVQVGLTEMDEACSSPPSLVQPGMATLHTPPPPPTAAAAAGVCPSSSSSVFLLCMYV